MADSDPHASRPPSLRGREAARLFQAAAGHHRQGELERAVDGYSRALALEPDAPDAYLNLGAALRSLGRGEAAIACYRRALALGAPEAHVQSNLGNALRDQQRYEEAALAHRRAVELAPDSADALYNLSLVLRDLGALDEALACLERALAREPQNPEYLWDRALTRLQAGDYAAGFAEYEARWRLRRMPPRRFDRPRWDGGELAGRTLLLHHEQGFGDMIQFARFAPLVRQQFGGRVLLEAPPELLRVFTSLPGIDGVTARGGPTPDFDVWLPLLSLPALLRVTLDDLPAPSAYLAAPEMHRMHLAVPPGRTFKVGIAWAGKAVPRDRSVPVRHFLGLMGRPDIAFFSLQKGDPAHALDAEGCPALVEDLRRYLGDFADTAAAIEQLDLVITVDSAVAHLAGALGKPVWTLLLYAADWRWMTGRDDSPWYPSMRLFRQPRPGDWESVFEEVSAALAEAARNTSPAGSAK